MGELLRRPVYHVQNESTICIDTPQVRQEFSKRNVILLKADWTNGDPEIRQILKASRIARGVSKASRFTRGKPSVPHCVYTGRAKSRRFVHREGKAGRFTYELSRARQ